MSYIVTNELKQSAVLYLYAIRSEIQEDPPYQRQGDIWPQSKKQLLIDSILNDFDIPKLYLHKIQHSTFRHAIIDGKQRLEAIWDFIEGKYPLSDDIKYLRDESINLEGLTYAELGKFQPMIKQRFDSTTLNVIEVETDEIELIEEMFTRLNEAATLTAAEKRNALGGPVPPLIRKISTHSFFTQRLPFANLRYRHFDLACKFLLIASNQKIPDTKKIHLDNFVKSYKARHDQGDLSVDVSLLSWEESINACLRLMSAKFTDSDTLLSSVGLVVVYYCLHYLHPEAASRFDRSKIQIFERIRKENRALAANEEDERAPSFQLLEFDRLMQAPNDASSIRYKLEILLKFVNAGCPPNLDNAISAMDEA